MELGKNNKILKWIVLLPVLGIVVTSALLLSMYVRFENDNYHQTLEEEKRRLLKDTKVQARERIDSIASSLELNEKTLKQEVKNDVKHMVTLAVEMVNSIYLEHKQLPKDIIIEKVRNKLRNMRFFDDLSGYFFIHTLEGKCILLPTLPELENKDIMDIQDSQGTFITHDFISIARNDLEGFYEWYWYKLNEKQMKKKIGFIKVYEPLGIYVGSARYEEDILAHVKEESKRFLDDISYSEGGYIFAYDEEGNLVTDKKDANQFEKGSSEVSQIIRGSQISPEGFFISHTTMMQFDTNEALQYNSSFVRYIESLGWVIGVNTYGADVAKQIELKQKELHEKLENSVIKALSIAGGIILIVLFVMLEVSRRMNRILNYYQSRLILKHKKTLEQKKLLEHQVNHDILTSLPNRSLLFDRLTQLLKRAQRDGHKVAVVFIDVDKFKYINDTYGHHIGDLLLRKVSKRLKRSVRRSDIVARLSGDEFIMVIDKCEDIHNIVSVINKLKANFDKEFLLENIYHKIALSIGISVYPEDGDNPTDLLKNADTAMLKAKEDGRDNYKFFTNEMNEEVQKQIRVERELRHAIVNHEFVLHYQPIVNAKSSHIEGVEALIRWQHPEHGLVYPDYFIEIAEESNIIVEIGKWVTKEAMRQISSWYEMGLKPGRVSINFAGRQLVQEDLYDFILESLDETLCKPEWIGIEIVERFIMVNPEKSIELLKKFRAINIGISIDDFGTGASSLSYLKQLPITKLKIDRAFVKNLETSFEDRAIAKTILALGSGLYLKVLAEGVEDEAQREFLVQNGCTQMQGYLFSKPKPAEEITKLLQEQTTSEKSLI